MRICIVTKNIVKYNKSQTHVNLNNVEINIKNQQIKLNFLNESKELTNNYQLKQIDIKQDYIGTIAV